MVKRIHICFLEGARKRPMEKKKKTLGPPREIEHQPLGFCGKKALPLSYRENS